MENTSDTRREDGALSRPGRPRNATKALLRFSHQGGREIAIKDCSSKAWWLRVLICRPALRREARAYAALGGLEGLPECLGMDGPDRLVLVKVPGRALPEWPHHELPDGVLTTLTAIVHAIHRRGVAIADLHRSNVLVAEDGGVYLLDLAVARVARHPLRPGPIIRALQTLDLHAVERIRAWATGLEEPRPSGLFGATYRAFRLIKRFVSAEKPRR